ncbi:putative DNA-binding transcriptional regulator YafY [Microbacterium resistens]|uniref:DNA-binding transcriptional regulator YafY n=1 Tax=Microbacterium resistens TaxID=156977 RepID=A0ABU1S825_9MICO|nr:WYL domain-containing protein [Microbacterium resistens]MDR6865756.1 putative DNA-binding transcriptional regulator YafY [Microbacterium resistens]
MTERASRLLALLSFFQARRDWSGHALAERLGVGERTIRRDVELLRTMGYDVEASKGPDGGYRLGAGREIPPLLFDDDQAVAVALALQSAPAIGVDVGDAAERALSTLRQVMPSHLRHRLDRIRFLGEPAPERVAPETLAAVSDAVRDRMTLRFDYGTADAPPRRTQPHSVIARDGRWYLIAWDVDREDWRVFRLDRMRPRSPAGPSFPSRPIPGGDARAYLRARFKGAEMDRWPCIGTVVVDLPVAEVARWVTDDGGVEELPDGRSSVTLGSWSWTALLAQVLRFDAAFTIIDPPALRQAADALATRLSASTSTPASSSASPSAPAADPLAGVGGRS